MAKRSSASKESKSNKRSSIVDIPVDFGGISLGKDTARIGISFPMSVLSLEKAFETLCGHRLQCAITLDKSNDQENGQKRIVDDLDEQIDCLVDVKKIGVSPDTISAGLTLAIVDLDLPRFAKFRKSKGRLVVSSIQPLEPEELAADDHDDEGLDLEE